MVEIKEIGHIEKGTDKHQSNVVYDDNGLSPCLCATIGDKQPPPVMCEKVQYRIRKLTPIETWRLMDFNDEDFRKAEKVNSQTQLYKQAGNSIVTLVLAAIFSQLHIQGKKAWNDMEDVERLALMGRKE